jgi:hypothetical protein
MDLLFFMIEIFLCAEEFKESRHPVHILRRAGSGTVRARNGRLKFRVKITVVLEYDLMLAAVAKIVQTGEGAAFLFDQIPKTVNAAFKPVFF